MTHCWQFKPEDRPTFSQIVSQTHEMLTEIGLIQDLQALLEYDDDGYLEPNSINCQNERIYQNML